MNLRTSSRLPLLPVPALALAALAVAGLGAANAAPNQITATTPAGLKQAVAAQKGKVVMVNLWATWCGPCVAEFPDLVKLHNNYKAKGATVLSVSIDEPEDKPKVVKFIAAQKAGFPVVMRAKGSPEEFVGALDKKWEGAVPTTYIFDKSGKLISKPIIGGQSYQEFAGILDAALQGKPLPGVKAGTVAH